MAKELIYSVSSVNLSLTKKNPPDLIIDAHGKTSSNNWTDSELQPWVYIQPPRRPGRGGRAWGRT